MNTVDLINKLSVTHSLSSGRAEMILSIVFEKITEKLKKEGSTYIEGFGRFNVEEKRYSDKSHVASSGKYIKFTPDRYFLEKINT
jgi:nucleoid DNA-binding protein